MKAWICLVLGLAAAEAQTARVPTFSMETKLVEVPVVVRERGSGRPVRDLKKSDFAVYKGDRAQAIEHFQVITRVGAASPAAAAPRLAPGTFTNRRTGEESGPALVAILIDGYNARFEDQHAAARGVAEVASKLPVEARVGLFYLSQAGLKVIHDYTADRAGLLERLRRDQSAGNPVGPGLEMPNKRNEDLGRLAETIRLLHTLSALEALGDHLRPAPGRKSIVWLSAGMPFGPVFENLTDWHRVLNGLNDAGVAVYPVDSEGVRTMPAFRAEIATTRGTPLRGPMGTRASADTDVLRVISASTGGVASHETNDLGGAIARAVADSEVTYLLSYRTGRKTWDGSFVTIQVKVKRKDVEVRHRSGYYARAANPASEAERETTLKRAMASPLEATGIGLTISVKRDSDAKNLSVVVAAMPGSISLDKGRRGELQIRFSLRTAEGVVLDDFTDEVVLTLNEQQGRQVREEGFVYQRVLERKEKAATLKVALYDQRSGRVGSVIATLSAE